MFWERSVDYHQIKNSLDAFIYSISTAMDDGREIDKQQLDEIRQKIEELHEVVNDAIEYGVPQSNNEPQEF